MAESQIWTIWETFQLFQTEVL